MATKSQPKQPAKPAKPVVPKGQRPVTCGELYEFDPKANAAFAAEGCGRLPRHHGDHRPTLRVAAKPKPKASSRTKAPKGPQSLKALRAYRTALLDEVEAGTKTAAEALSSYAAAETAYRSARRAKAAARKPKAS